MKKVAFLILAMVLMLSACGKKQEPMQVVFVEHPQVYVGDQYHLSDFIISVTEGELVEDLMTYRATREGVYVYQLEGINSNGGRELFPLEVKALPSSMKPAQTKPYDIEIIEVGIDGFPINHDLMDSDESDELKREGVHFGTLESIEYDGIDYYQMPYFNFLFSVPSWMNSKAKMYVRFLDDLDLVYFGIYVQNPDVSEALQFTAMATVEEFIVLGHEYDPEKDEFEVGTFVMRLGDTFIYYSANNSQIEMSDEMRSQWNTLREGKPYITIYGS